MAMDDAYLAEIGNGRQKNAEGADKPAPPPKGKGNGKQAGKPAKPKRKA